MFLMYRVELKVSSCKLSSWEVEKVPNVPCGVESVSKAQTGSMHDICVPNVPCGVESNIHATFPS